MVTATLEAEVQQELRVRGMIVWLTVTVATRPSLMPWPSATSTATSSPRRCPSGAATPRCCESWRPTATALTPHLALLSKKAFPWIELVASSLLGPAAWRKYARWDNK